MYRELREETGLRPEHVDVLGATPGWLRYRLPKRYLRTNQRPLCIGQKQVWYLLQLTTSEQNIHLDVDGSPEFDHYRWVNYWYPLDNVIAFKRDVYRQALNHLAQHISVAQYDPSI